MINTSFKYALLTSSGVKPETAKKKVNRLLEPKIRRMTPEEYEKEPEVEYWLDMFRDADMPAEQMRKELIVLYLDDSRNEHLPIQARQKAREYLMKLFGLDQQKIAITSDDDFREFLLNSRNGA